MEVNKTLVGHIIRTKLNGLKYLPNEYRKQLVEIVQHDFPMKGAEEIGLAVDKALDVYFNGEQLWRW